MSIDDVLTKEVVRLEGIIETGRFSFLQRLSHSRAALITIAILVLLFQTRSLPELLANSSLDAAIAIQPPAQPRSVRMVVIDDQDYANLFHARSPLDPDLLSKVLDAVARGGPRAIVLDVDTSDNSFQSMKTPSVPMVWNVSGDQQVDGNFTFDKPMGGSAIASGSVAALAVAPRDDRGIVRGYQQMYPLEGGGTIDSPGYAAAQIFAGKPPGAPNPHGGDVHYLDYRYRFARIKVRDLLQDAQSAAWDTMGSFAGQVVVIGGAYRVGRDQYATPKGLTDGCEIVAQEASSEIEGTYIKAANRWSTGLLMILGGLTTLAIFHWLSFRLAFLVSLALVPILSIASNWILFHRLAAWGAMVPLVIAVIMAELYSKAALYLAFYQKMASLKTRGTAKS